MNVSLTHQKWDAALDGAQVYEPNERERIRRALDMAEHLLEEFPRPLNWVVAAFRNYSREDRRLPLMAEASFQSDQEYADLEWELAEKVLGPVYQATRISMPVTLCAPVPGAPGRPSGPGLLYPPSPP